jgi:TPR repeat protein
MTEIATETTVDWEKCWAAATQLGAITRQLIVDREYDTAREWALRMASAHGQGSPANGQRALSYYELAVLLGHENKDVDGRAQLDWEALLGEAAKLKVAVETKAKDAKAALAKADERLARAEERFSAAERAKAKAEAVALDEGEPADEEEVDDDERAGN